MYAITIETNGLLKRSHDENHVAIKAVLEIPLKRKEEDQSIAWAKRKCDNSNNDSD